MDSVDRFTRAHFNRRIQFCPSGETRFAGIAINLELAARLTGAPDESIVTLDVDDQAAVFIVQNAMFAQPAIRSLYWDEEGEFVVGNSDLVLNKSGQGIGRRMIATQAIVAQEYGIRKIKLCAATGKDNNGRELNGHYTWARCGFDARLDLPHLIALPPTLKGSRTVQDVMCTAEGKIWWQTRSSGYNMTFDLDAGSLSWRILDAYLLESKVRMNR